MNLLQIVVFGVVVGFLASAGYLWNTGSGQRRTLKWLTLAVGLMLASFVVPHLFQS